MVHQIRRAAVLGHPIAHSLSPTLHSAAYAHLGLEDWEYGRFDITEEQLPAFLDNLDPTWAGLSLTMPLKQTVIPLLDHIEPLAEVTGAVNTVVFSGVGAGRTSVGTNTDVHGIVAALQEGSLGLAEGEKLQTAAIIGAGATASSALAALAQLGCTNPAVYVRSLGRTGTLRAAAHRMGVEPTFHVLSEAAKELPEHDAVISTLPPFAADELAATLLGNGTQVQGVLLDVAYDPAPTALVSSWRNLASPNSGAVTGERMLLHQAAEQVRLMTGRPGPVDVMSQALERILTDH